MKIESIKKSGSNQYCIILEDKTKKKLYDDIILKSGLLFKKEITEEELDDLEKESQKQDAYYQILNLLSRKMRSKKEIRDYLEKKEIALEEQDRIIERLEKNRLLNDDLYARAYVQDRLLLSSDGPNKVRDYLFKQDISIEIIDKYIENYPEEDIYAKAEKIILKKAKSNTNKSGYALKQQIILDMINLGYDKGLVMDILDCVSIESNSKAVTKEYQKIQRRLSAKYQGEDLERQIYYKLRSKGFSDVEIDNMAK